jgi:hypothetical protein
MPVSSSQSDADVTVDDPSCEPITARASRPPVKKIKFSARNPTRRAKT